MKYAGVVVPIVTPVTRDYQIDTAGVGRIVDLLVGNGIRGIFPLGTTGEAASIHPADRRVMIEATVKHTAGRAMVYVGIASNSFRESVESAKFCQQLGGVDAVVAHMPSYYPLNDAEIETYFLKLADAVPLPLVLYNIPVTTHHHISLEVVDRLREHKNIVAIKDSSGDAARMTELLKRCGGRGGFPVLIGSSAVFAHGLKHGGVGLVPSGAHVVPAEYQRMFDAAMANDWPTVEQMQKVTDEAVAPYLKGRSLGQGLAMLKSILEKRGICGRTMLPPLRDCLEV